MILIYILRDILSALYRGMPFSEKNAYQGFQLYKRYPTRDKKNIIRVLIDLEKLSWYWKCFPETYFQYGMFLKTYTDFNLMKTFLPDLAYYRIVQPKSKVYNILFDDKIIFHNLMKCYGLPTTERFFVWQYNKFYDGVKVISDEKVNSIINQITDERIFVKLFKAGGGSGISIFTRKEEGYYDENNNKLSAYLIREKYKNEKYIFEKQIIQNSVIGKFNPDTVNTIRVYTKDDKIISAVIRFGRKGEFIDNISKGGLAVRVDIESGQLNNFGLRKYDLNKYYMHPDTDVSFKNTTIPKWVEVKRLITRALSFFPYYKSVGFDIAITNNGPIIVEINSSAQLRSGQMGRKTGLADVFVNKGYSN